MNNTSFEWNFLPEPIFRRPTTYSGGCIIDDLFNMVRNGDAVERICNLWRKVTQHGKTQIGPLTAYIKIAVQQMSLNTPSHAQLRPLIAKQALQNAKVKARDKEQTALSELEKESINVWLKRIYGGLTQKLPLKNTLRELKQFTTALYRIPELSSLRLGTVINFLNNHCFDRWDFAKLPPSTMRRAMRPIVPKSALRKGRGGKSDIQLLRNILDKHFKELKLGSFTYQS